MTPEAEKTDRRPDAKLTPEWSPGTYREPVPVLFQFPPRHPIPAFFFGGSRWWDLLPRACRRIGAPTIALAIALWPSAARPSDQGDLGRKLYESASPTCAACHNARRGDLSRSKAPRDYVKAIILEGSAEKMPAYRRFTARELEAVVDYVMSLREKAAQ